MQAQDLIALLSELEPDTEIRFASQPSWPFENSIKGLWAPDPYASEDEDGEEVCNVDEDGDPMHPSHKVAYLVEGKQIGYLPGYARSCFDECSSGR